MDLVAHSLWPLSLSSFRFLFLILLSHIFLCDLVNSTISLLFALTCINKVYSAFFSLSLALSFHDFYLYRSINFHSIFFVSNFQDIGLPFPLLTLIRCSLFVLASWIYDTFTTIAFGSFWSFLFCLQLANWFFLLVLDITSISTYGIRGTTLSFLIVRNSI